MNLCVLRRDISIEKENLCRFSSLPPPVAGHWCVQASKGRQKGPFAIIFSPLVEIAIETTDSESMDSVLLYHNWYLSQRELVEKEPRSPSLLFMAIVL